MHRAEQPAAARVDLTAIDVNAMILFHEVVNSGSINQAAISLRISKARISRKLRSLERQMGAVLLKRGPQRLSMTPSGEVLFHHCERILAEALDARTALTEMQSELKGKLQVVAPFGLAPWITRAVTHFAEAYPRLEIGVDLTHRWVDVSEEPYDVAIHLGRIVNERLPVRRFAELARGVYVSPSHLKGKTVPQVPADLLRHSCIVLKQQIDDSIWQFREANGSSATVTPRVRASDLLVAHHLAVAGLGFAILPHAYCRGAVASGQLVRVLPKWRIPSLTPSATYLERRYMPTRIRAFLETVAAEFKRDPAQGEERSLNHCAGTLNSP
jgi:DNA-binding transcriptional LysR family regulator